ncbi:hypothetical protein, partial [Sphingobium mellinum]|uniref:hypothetical protein n=1 Tax=Sphingobium mellinum TaxID=1387166 RepID=UPI0030ED1240
HRLDPTLCPSHRKIMKYQLIISNQALRRIPSHSAMQMSIMLISIACGSWRADTPAMLLARNAKALDPA